MKNIILLVLIFISVSCHRGFEPDYIYTWKLKVTYTNGEIDTVNCNRESFKGNKVSLYLKTSDPGVLVNASMVPCIVTHCGFYTEIIVCGIRKYEVLESKKEILKIQKYKLKKEFR